MTVEKALQMIDNILAQVSLRRDEHMNVQQAMAVIRSATRPVGEGKLVPDGCEVVEPSDNGAQTPS